MFYLLCKTSFLHGRPIITASQSYKLLRILQNESSIFKSSCTLRFISTTSNRHSFTVSYLINKCRFSPERASWASMHVRFETPEKPDSVIAFLDKHGFSKTQVTNIVRKQLELLVYNTGRTLLPKIEFLYSVGFSGPDLIKLLTNYPTLFKTSLEKQIIPVFNDIRNLFQSNDKAIKVIKRFSGILSHNLDSNLFPNMDILRRHGVPESNILTIFLNQPRMLMFGSVVRFKEIVEEVKRMGIDSSKMKFLVAIVALRSMSKSTLEKKFDIYRRWGWSDQEICEAFRKYPRCLTVSEDKIMAVMDFLVNKMGFDSTLVAKKSSVLLQSLEKRIVPRALFALELLSRGLVNDFTLSVLFDTSEEVFLRILVNRHADKALELLKLYEQKLNKSELKQTAALDFCRICTLRFRIVFGSFKI